MSALLDVTLPIFLIIGAGYFAVWRRWFSEGGVDALMKYTQGFAIPCLLFRAISGLELGENFNFPLLFSFYGGSVFAFFLGAVGARILFSRPAPDAIAIGFAAMFANSVLLGLPVTERAFGAQALAPNYAIIAIHAPVCYLFGITSMEIVRNKGLGLMVGLTSVATSMVRNPLMIGIFLGFVVNLTAFSLPEPLTTALDLVARSALPAALFGLGGVLVKYRPEGDLLQIGFVLCITLMLHPIVTWSLSGLMDLPRGAMQSAVLTASMAPGVNAYIFASMYGVGKRVVASSVLIGTALSIVTVSAWLHIIG